MTKFSLLLLLEKQSLLQVLSLSCNTTGQIFTQILIHSRQFSEESIWSRWHHLYISCHWDQMLCYPVSRKKLEYYELKRKDFNICNLLRGDQIAIEGETNMTTDLDWDRWALENKFVWGQQPRVSLKASDACQTQTRNTAIKMQIFGYRTQQWIKHNCAISVEKSVFFSKPVCTNASSSLTHLYAKAVTFSCILPISYVWIH